MSCEKIQKQLENIVVQRQGDSELEERAEGLRGKITVTCKIREGKLTHTGRIMHGERNEREWKEAKLQAESLLRDTSNS